MEKKPDFWENWEQANDRLRETYVLYDHDPAYVNIVSPPAARGDSPPVSVTIGDTTRVVYLRDPLFHRFRKLPPVGWINHVGLTSALFLDRRPVRSTKHGLTNNNVGVGAVRMETGELSWRHHNFTGVVQDAGYHLACKGEYPDLKTVLSCLREKSCIAVSPKYAVLRDDKGLRWFYRNGDKVGAFFDTESLLLFANYSYLKEELSESPVITVAQIKEF